MKHITVIQIQNGHTTPSAFVAKVRIKKRSGKVVDVTALSKLVPLVEAKAQADRLIAKEQAQTRQAHPDRG